jgi:uncharacterized protein YndB with AHSA1/START domain
MPVDGLSIRRVLRVPRTRVFQAWTRPELMARWFFPGSDWTATITHDLRVGGRWEIVMLDARGGRHLQFGEYREVVPESRLVFTWNCPDLGVADSVVTVELREHEQGTELLLSHELPPEPQIRSGHEAGWQGCLDNLERLLSVSPEENEK